MATILIDSSAPRQVIPPWAADESLVESLLSGMGVPRGVGDRSGIVFDAVLVSGRDSDGYATGFEFVGNHRDNIDATSDPGRAVQGHFDLTGRSAWIQFLE